ncbi:MAG: sigma-70 family RNA polymerase sigma factor [Verrucomicrobia bacterium]|nr:sigma-70 family RNA polymerase sigma factor [Verrucomicrobiota bacterium]
MSTVDLLSAAKTGMKNDDPSIATHASLLEKLRDLEDQASWRRFFDTYAGLIRRVALQAGLSQADAEDVLQETAISVARHLPGFRYDPKICSFKTWMLRLTRWRVIDHFRKRQLQAGSLDPATGDTDADAELDRVTGGRAPEVEAVWEQEWREATLAAALERVRANVHPQTFQMFDLHVLRGMSAGETAQLLGVNIARVYLARHRVGKKLRDETRSIETTGILPCDG